MVYVRYRWGNLTIEVSPEPSNDIYDAIDGIEVFSQELGGGLDGHLTYDQLKTATAEIIEFPPSEAA